MLDDDENDDTASDISPPRNHVKQDQALDALDGNDDEEADYDILKDLQQNRDIIDINTAPAMPMATLPENTSVAPELYHDVSYNARAVPIARYIIQTVEFDI
eukprot:scaffold128725_cov62-Attheya_sp.AAC.1